MAKRKAVTILMTRDLNSSEVFLVERNPKLRFFGGYYAFPGGTVDVEDSASDALGDKGAQAVDQAVIFTAARELFEETGVLISTDNRKLPVERLRDYRKKLLNEELTFSEILASEQVRVDSARFKKLCTFVTPEFAPVRYDTDFFYVEVPASAKPEVWSGELVRGAFFEAREAVRLWKAGDMHIVPPVIWMLFYLERTGLKAAVEPIRQVADAYARGTIHQIYFTPGIQMLPLKTRTLLPATHTNAYIVGEERLYLIDPAPSDQREQERLWAYMDKMTGEGRHFEAILLTHHHSDHIGAVRECQTRYGLPLMAHAATARQLPQFEFSRHLQHNDTLDLGHAPDGLPGWSLRVYHTPGHASGHLAFQETRYNAVIAADLISTLSTIVISPPDGHLAMYLKSLAFLESVTTATLYPSHGPAVKEGRSVIRQYMRHRQEREDKLVTALSNTPQSTYELVPKVYDDVESHVWPLAEHSLRAGLIKLIEEKKCQQVGDGYCLI